MCKIDFSRSDPVSMALSAIMLAIQNGRPVSFSDIREVAYQNSIGLEDTRFDRAAALVGMPYSPSMDAYLDVETWAAVELPVAHWRVPPDVIEIVEWHLEPDQRVSQ